MSKFDFTAKMKKEHHEESVNKTKATERINESLIKEKAQQPKRNTANEDQARNYHKRHSNQDQPRKRDETKNKGGRPKGRNFNKTKFSLLIDINILDKARTIAQIENKNVNEIIERGINKLAKQYDEDLFNRIKAARKM